jgi:hypothetical protein
MRDEAKLNTAMARLRTWLLADINERIKRETQPLVSLEYAVTLCARTRRTGCSARRPMLGNAAALALL